MSAALQEAADVKTDHLGEKYGTDTLTQDGRRDKTAATVTEMDAEVAHQLNHRRLSPRMIQLLALAVSCSPPPAPAHVELHTDH